jgi:hypothetical protein
MAGGTGLASLEGLGVKAAEDKVCGVVGGGRYRTIGRTFELAFNLRS